MGMIETGALIALVTIGSWFGGFFGTYMKKKGENLATKEDIDELTRRTKEIEAKIDDQVWNRQRQWELKRDTLLEAIKAIALVRIALYRVIAAFRAYSAATTDEQRNLLLARKTEAIETWPNAMEQFETGRILVAVLGDANLNDALRGFGTSVRAAYDSMAKDEPVERFDRLMETVKGYDTESLAAARTALGISAD